MTGRPDNLREKRCILVRTSGVFICDHVASLFLDLSWGRTSWRKQHELPRMARKQKRHSPEEGTREKHTFQRHTLKWPVFSKQVLPNFHYFLSNYDSANNKFIDEVRLNVSQSFAKACFWTLLHGNQGFNIRVFGETFSYPIVMISFDFSFGIT